MEDQVLVEALRVREPDAPTSVYGAYADRLYAYCWLRLQARDDAQVALRDTFIAAEAHIDKLRDPELFGPWLYALARVQCARRPPSENRAPDPPVASHDQEDVDERLVSWKVVQALSPLAQDVLELHVRRGLSIPELAAVLGLGSGYVQVALDRAHVELEEALTAEMLECQGPYGCAERASLLKQRGGGAAQGTDGRLLRHAETCTECEAFRPRTVSAAKIFDLLPEVAPPDELRVRVTSCFTDPELVGYRLFVATGITAFTPAGFPVLGNDSPRPFRGCSSRRRFRRVGMVLATVVVLGGGGFVWTTLGADGRGVQRIETVVGPDSSSEPETPQDPSVSEGASGDGPVRVHETHGSPVPSGHGPWTDGRPLSASEPADTSGVGPGPSGRPPGDSPQVPEPPPTSPSAPAPSSPEPPPSGGTSPPATSPPPSPPDEPTSPPASPPASGQSPTPAG